MGVEGSKILRHYLKVSQSKDYTVFKLLVFLIINLLYWLHQRNILTTTAPWLI